MNLLPPPPHRHSNEPMTSCIRIGFGSSTAAGAFLYMMELVELGLYCPLLLFCLPLSPFPAMADAVQAEVDGYKTSEEEMKSLKSAMVR